MNSIPADATTEFAMPDGKTSFWDDGVDADRRSLVLKALLLNRHSIGRMPAVTLWRDDLSPDLSGRIIQTDGLSPVIEANAFHFELQAPDEQDYAEFALAVVKRRDFIEVSADAARSLIEEAFIAGQFALDDLRSEKLRREVRKLLIKRKRLDEP